MPWNSKPITRIYDYNYDVGEHYYKPQLKHIDDRYRGVRADPPTAKTFAERMADDPLCCCKARSKPHVHDHRFPYIPDRYSPFDLPSRFRPSSLDPFDREDGPEDHLGVPNSARSKSQSRLPLPPAPDVLDRRCGSKLDDPRAAVQEAIDDFFQPRRGRGGGGDIGPRAKSASSSVDDNFLRAPRATAASGKASPFSRRLREDLSQELDNYLDDDTAELGIKDRVKRRLAKIDAEIQDLSLSDGEGRRGRRTFDDGELASSALKQGSAAVNASRTSAVTSLTSSVIRQKKVEDHSSQRLSAQREEEASLLDSRRRSRLRRAAERAERARADIEEEDIIRGGGRPSEFGRASRRIPRAGPWLDEETERGLGSGKSGAFGCERYYV